MRKCKLQSLKVKTVITAGTLFTPLDAVDSAVVVIEDGRVREVYSREQAELPAGAKRLDFPQMVVAPGFIDVHVHGHAGQDVMNADGEGLAVLEGAMARHGVTSYLPTTVSAPEDRILRALENLGRAISRGPARSRSRPVAIHLEGPFLSHAKRGVHPPENLLAPSVEILDRFWQASGGNIGLMTIAPELPGAIETIQHARHLGIHASLGHSDADSRQTELGIAAGADHATHTFNAMRPLDHRDPGILGAALSDDRLTADIIADGIHVHPSLVKLFLAAKGAERAILITDAISATGMGDGKYKLGSLEVEVKGDRCDFQGKLAGSVLTLDRAVRNAMSFAGWKLQQAIRLVTCNPARRLEISEKKGSIAPGCDADLVILTPEGKVIATVIGGELVNA